MAYVNVREMLRRARIERYAVGAFNVVDCATTMAVVKAAECMRSPVIIQVSAKTVDLYNPQVIAGWVKELGRSVSVPIALHLDHCRDINLIRDCINAGWSSVMIDASSFPLDENIRITKEVVALAKDRDVTVEGEVGSIVGVEDELFVNEDDAFLADPQSCMRYVEETGVDVLAPAIGTAHGNYRKEPNIHFRLISQIAELTNLPLAIHGGTGLSAETFRQCIAAGGTKINVSTRIKHLFRDSLEEYFKNHPDEYEPVRVLRRLHDVVCQGVESFIEIFGSAGKA